jgi:IclR family KDG regulon transcriptional repressor
VATLRGRGYLEAVDGGYVLGVRLFELGRAYHGRLNLASLGEAAARRVVDACQETSQVAVLDGTEVVYIARVDGTHSVRLVSEVGQRLPAHCTGLGKALLSGLSDDELERRYPEGEALPSMTPSSITHAAKLKRAILAVRSSGVAFDDCESNIALRCVAAPIPDAEGRVVAAISVSVPTVRWNDDQQRRLTALVLNGSTEVSRRLGALFPERATA